VHAFEEVDHYGVGNFEPRLEGVSFNFAEITTDVYCAVAVEEG